MPMAPPATSSSRGAGASSSMDDFDVQRELGRGSYGVVFKVRRKIDEQVYVMKVIHIRELSKKKAETQKDMDREYHLREEDTIS